MNAPVLSVRLSLEAKEKLERLAAATGRTKSYLAAEAIERFVARELAIVEAIQRGLDDAKAGRVVSQEQVDAELEEIIQRAERARRRA